MAHLVSRLAEAIAAVGAVAGLGYYYLSIWSALKYIRKTSDRPESFYPPVSILKPLKGTDPEMYESLRSHCVQEYPEYEIIFGVSDGHDASIEIVEQLRKEFPALSIRLLVCSDILGTNVKVSNLAQMVRVAQHAYLVVNDSDIRVKPDYLRRVIAPLSDSHAGLVTALYRGIPANSLGSRLESLGISTDFSAGVLSAEQVEGGVRFGLGSTLVFRKRELEAIGGFESLLDYLADDYELGVRIAERGFQVKLAECVVETFLPEYSFREFVSHQLRWARAVRDSRPWGYFGLLLTFGFAWAVLAVLLAQGAVWSWWLLLVVLIARVTMAVKVGKSVLRDSNVLSLLWLIPIRDLLFVFIWMASYAGHKIHWRGSDFYLRSGKLVRVP
jgi:ceramide glucosyltransferase